jgi:serine/threonine protein kinase
VLVRPGFRHTSLVEVLVEAARVQRLQLADWRVSPAAEASRRFGSVRIPGYRCVRRLAGGSVSQLYLAESEKAGSLVVIKVTPSVRDASGVDQSFERFLQEYEIAHRMHHASIVRCHELGVADDHAYLAMEYFPDGDLRRRIRAGISPAEALDIAAQIAGALAILHEAGALHRDLKPGNVLMRGQRVALSDFGLAKHALVDLEITDPGIIFGTPHYMSPEQGHGELVDERSDLYSLGVIFFEMLTGSKPYLGATAVEVLQQHVTAAVPQLPAELQHHQVLLESLMAKPRDDRFATPDDLLAHLQQQAA